MGLQRATTASSSRSAALFKELGERTGEATRVKSLVFHSNMPKAIFYLLTGDYRLLRLNQPVGYGLLGEEWNLTWFKHYKTTTHLDFGSLGRAWKQKSNVAA